MSKRRQVSETPLMLGYSRVSTEEQAKSGNGLKAQRAEIEADASRRGWAVDPLFPGMTLLACEWKR